MSEQENKKNDMIYVPLGKTGLQVSRLSFGSWVSFKEQIDESVAHDMMVTAYEHGVNFFDCAEGYAKGAAETMMGKIIQSGLKKGTWLRSDLVVTTKIFFGTEEGTSDGHNAQGLSRKHIVEGTQASLKRLQLDYVDVIFCHRPDPITPIEETVRAMNYVIEKGWAFYWGTSEWNAYQISEAANIACRLGLIGPCVEQVEYNIFRRSRVEFEYEPLYCNLGLGLTTFSPLGCGILTGKYSGFNAPKDSRLSLPQYDWLREVKFEKHPDDIPKTDQLSAIAAELGCTLAQLAIAWCLKNKHASTVITGATSVDQVVENMKSLQVLPKLTCEIMKRIEQIAESQVEPDAVTKQVQGIRGKRTGVSEKEEKEEEH